MALVPDQKFSTFQNGGTPTTGDIVVGLRAGINTKFNWVLPTTVDTITGTANQVLVDGSSGVPVTGDVTLSTPQDIATTSSPTFNALTLTTALTVPNGGTGRQTLTAYTLLAGGTTSTGAIQSVTAGSSGQILQSNGAAALPTWVTLSSIGVTSITGTANQVLANATSATPQVGAVTLTTPQDIATTSSPTFNALTLTNPLTGANGGTGVNNGTKTINLGTPTTGYVLTSDVSGNATWQTVSASGAITTINGNSGSITPTAGAVTINGGTTGLTTSGSGSTLSLTGTLVVANGGTGLASLTAYTLLAGGTTSTGVLQQVTAGSSGQLLQSNGAGVLPSWTTATFPSGSGTLNHLLRSDGTNWVQTTATTLDASDVLSGLTQLNVDNLRLDGNTISSTDTNGNMVFAPDGTGGILQSSNSTPPIPFSGGLDYQISSNRTGGTGYGATYFGTSTNNAPLLYFSRSKNATINSHTAVTSGDALGSWVCTGDDGTNYNPAGAQIIARVDGAVSTNIVPTRWEFKTTNSLGTNTLAMTINSSQIITLANALPVGSGGLGITTTPTNGQIPIGNGTNYVAAALTAGTGISITNGSGSISIATTSFALAWSNVAGTTQAAAINSGYVIGNAAQTTVTLPATAALGSIVAVQGKGAGGWILTANGGQTIQVGSSATSAGGTVTSANQWDAIEVVCVTADTTWAMRPPVSSGYTIA